MQDLNLPGGVDDEALRHAARTCSTRSTTTSPARRSRDDLDGDGHVLPAGLQPDQLSEKAREAFNINAEPTPSSATSTAATPPASGCCMARRLVEAGVRFVSLTYGGWDMHGGIKAGMQSQLPAVRPGVRRADHATSTSAGCSTARWSWSRASSAARRRSTAPPAATTGRRSSASSWPAAASRRARSTARPTRRRREPEDDPLTVEDLAHDGLPPARHQRRQEADVPRQPAASRSCDGGKVAQGAAGVTRCSRVGRTSRTRGTDAAPTAPTTRRARVSD